MTLRKLQKYITVGLISCIVVLTITAMLTKMEYLVFLALAAGLMGIAMIIMGKYGKCKNCGISILTLRGVSPNNTNYCPKCGSPIDWDEKI